MKKTERACQKFNWVKIPQKEDLVLHHRSTTSLENIERARKELRHLLEEALVRAGFLADNHGLADTLLPVRIAALLEQTSSPWETVAMVRFQQMLMKLDQKLH